MNSPKSLITPTYLQAGDTVGIVAMASKLERDSIHAAVEKLTAWGLNVIIGDSVGASDFTFSGTDGVRLQDFQAMLDNPEVRAVFSARGGYGSSRIIDAVDFTGFQHSPKWVVGFSDITAIHGKIQNIGYQSIHGPMPKTMLWDAASDDSLRKVLFGERIDYKFPVDTLNRMGETTGRLIGGNLALLVHNIGSASEVSFDGKILFIEDVGEYLYNIDRMMVQLVRAGKLSNLAGLLVGQFSDVKENDEPFGKTAYEIIAEHTSGHSYPIAFDVPIGHTNENFAVRCGEMMSLQVAEKNVELQSITDFL
jgi:muramoyltetrapeptide carboxypeptidase